MIDADLVFDGLASRFAPGTIGTPTGAVAMRWSKATRPKSAPTTPGAYVEVDQGTILADSSIWKHEWDADVVFLLSKRPGDPERVDEQRQLWLPYLLSATEGQLKLGVGSQSGWELLKAIPTGWQYDEVAVGAEEFDAIRVHFRMWINETVSLVA